MRLIELAAAGLAAFAALAAPAAANGTAPAGTPENVLILVSADVTNVLTIVQAPRTGARAEATLEGTANGAAEGGIWHRAFSAIAPAAPALAPGSLFQEGLFQTATLRVEGTSNLFAARQSGASHSLSGVVVGNLNQAMVIQAGHGHTANFRQIGTGNSLSTRQSSW